MKNTSIILIVVILFFSCNRQKEKIFRIGQKSITFVDESRNRPLPTEIWYPTLDTLTKKESKKN